jgi:hypothetical protein
MKEAFKEIKFNARSLELINTADEIIKNYSAQGFKLTLRQLYYQFVSKAVIENTERSYKNLGALISDARLAGMLDWEAIEDRTRNLRARSHWNSPDEIAATCVHSYYKDRWANQKFRVEVWVEKEALAGVAEAACRPLDIPFFCCKGYTSQSEMYAAAKRLEDYRLDNQKPVVIHLGDHDPSGIDMSRDIQERLIMFTGGEFAFHRIALNRDQITKYNPPPNPAKVTDSRFKKYMRSHGDKSWELDALEPKVLVDLIKKKAAEFIDADAWEEVEVSEDRGRNALRKMVKMLEEEE